MRSTLFAIPVCFVFGVSAVCSCSEEGLARFFLAGAVLFAEVFAAEPPFATPPAFLFAADFAIVAPLALLPVFLSAAEVLFGVRFALPLCDEFVAAELFTADFREPVPLCADPFFGAFFFARRAGRSLLLRRRLHCVSLPVGAGDGSTFRIAAARELFVILHRNSKKMRLRRELHSASCDQIYYIIVYARTQTFYFIILFKAHRSVAHCGKISPIIFYQPAELLQNARIWFTILSETNFGGLA